MCHGASGRGEGWLSEHLKNRPPSLTRLRKNNGGVFPFEQVYEVIDGRKEVRIHGPRDMPVWGFAYRREAEKSYNPYFDQYLVDEGVVRARILALVEYISQLQE